LKKFRLIYALLTFIALCANAFGQSTTGSISGNVTDSSGASLPGATITLLNTNTNNIDHTTTSNETGEFTIPQVQPGTYNITVEKDGFKKFIKSNIVLSAADRLNAGDFTLEIGGVNEVVQVEADASTLLIKTESGERSEVIDSRQITNLAMNGRNLLDLMRLIPGVTSTVNAQVSNPTNQLNQFSINGTRRNQHDLVIDGSANVSTGSNNSQHVTINPDAVAEVKVLTSNFQAEYGKAGGGVVQFITKSGTDQFHGSARYYRRHDSLNANDYFRNAEGRNPDGSERQPRRLYRYNYYGYDIGGPLPLPRFGEGGSPLIKGKAFFFFSQEYYDQLIPQGTRNIRVPTLAERNGDFRGTTNGRGEPVFITDPLTPSNALPCSASRTVQNPGRCFVGTDPVTGTPALHIIPRDRWYQNGQQILSFYPTPNVTNNPQFNYTSAFSQEYPRREDIVRLDFNISEKTRFTARVINNSDEQLSYYGGGFWSGINFPLGQMRTARPGTNGSFTLFHTFSPTLTNEFIFGPSKAIVTINAVDDSLTQAGNNLAVPNLFPRANPGDYIPNFQYGGIPNQTFPSSEFEGTPISVKNTTLNFVDNLTKVFTKHTVKAGIYIQRGRTDQGTNLNTSPTISFNNEETNPLNTGHPFANALLGHYNSYIQADNHPRGYFRYTNLEFYLQDTWKIHRRLTLDYGMRFSYYQPEYDERLQTNVFNPALYDPSKAVRLYQPVCIGVSPCAAGSAVASSLRAVDPANPTGPKLPSAYIGLIVPNSGDPLNGIGRASEGYPKGGFESAGLLLGPRFGFAYDVFGTAKTVVRGGAGIAYDRVEGNTVIDQLNTPPTVFTRRLFLGRLSDLNSGNVFLAPPSVVGFARDAKVPSVYSMSLGIQQDLGFDTVIDVAYVGTLSRHLLQRRNINAIPYGTLFTRAAQDPTRYGATGIPNVEASLPLAYQQAGLSFTGSNALRADFLRPYRGYGDINYREFVGSSNYHSLQVAVNRRYNRSFTYGLSYTYSKAMGTEDVNTGNTHPFDARGYDYSVLDFDRTHIMTINYVYDLPSIARYLGNNLVSKSIFSGWQISGISQFYSGTPTDLTLSVSGVNATQRFVGSYTAELAPRLMIVGDFNSGTLQVNPDAFRVPSVGSTVRGPIRYLRNPAFFNHDISIFKNFFFGGENKRYLQFRVELFNAFNHTQFTGFNRTTNITTATNATGAAIFNVPTETLRITNNLRNGQSGPLGRYFGEYNAARDPRIIQLGMKLFF
jgi:hypothetical protein